MNWEKSCGAVVFTKKNGHVEYLLVQQHGGRHGFPKGHVEGSETEQETALREIKEETGLEVKLYDSFRRTEEYLIFNKPNTKKKVVYFLAEFSGQDPVPQQGEINKIELLPYPQALEKLEIFDKKRILKAANSYITSLPIA